MEDYKHLDRKSRGEITNLTQKMTLAGGGGFINIIGYSSLLCYYTIVSKLAQFNTNLNFYSK